MVWRHLFQSVFAISIVLLTSTGWAAVSEAGLIPLETFAAAHFQRSANLSPDGRHIAVLDIVGDQPVIQILRIDEDEISLTSSFEFAQSQIDEMHWVNANNLLISQTIVPLEVREKASLRRQLVRIDIEEGIASELWASDVNRLIANQPGSILRVLGGVQGNVLIAVPPDEGFFPSVQILNIFSGKVKLVESSVSGITRWLTDWDGGVRLGTGIDDQDQSIVWYRETIEAEWTNLSRNKVFSAGYFEPIAFDKAGTSLYMKSALGKGRKGLYEFNLVKERITRKIYEHPRYDIGTVFLSNSNREVAAVSYIDDYFQVDYLSDDFQEILATVTRYLPDAANIVMDWSSRKDVFLIYSERPPFPPRHYVFQASNEKLTELPGGLKEIRNYPLILPERITYFSRDGLEIPAYLTRPQPLQQKPAATVILPHGGPWARDYITYNDWVQFFANRGYIVLQPNFRGSSGYGIVFQSGGYGEWGEAMQRDLDDGVLWLIEQGITDPDQVCIAGGSYGGYAALMASIESADLYKCAIAFAPVTSLSKFSSSFNRSPYKKGQQSMIGGVENKAPLRKNSPVRRGRDVKIPVLLIHGTSDIRVPVYHSRDMVRALKKSKAPSVYLELEGESHFLGKPSNRLEVFRAMEKHLQQYLVP